MTVMLLQRSASPQLTHSQKIANSNTKPPFLFFFESQEHRSSDSKNNNNNNSTGTNNNVIRNNNNSKIIRTTTRESGDSGVSGRIGGGGGGYGGSGGICSGGGVSGCGSGGGGGAGVAAAATSYTRIGGQGVAMRYYRLWIYACNIVVFGSAVGLATAVSRTLLFSGDPRRQLIPGVPRAFDPTALYAYLALATQLGLMQFLGCVAARRLNTRLLNAYWILLLALLFGDTVVGIAWVFRFERMCAELRPTLRFKLQTEYAKEPRFSEQWDRLQREFSCCGVTGPRDFGSRWPQTCCPPASNASESCLQPYVRGCEETLIRWLRRTADLLFVLGFCVITFAKLCFLGILRYEIREMIQKIRLLREPPSAVPPLIQPFSQVIPDTTNNGGIIRRPTLPTATSGNATLLMQSDDCNSGRHPLLASTVQDGGADSDTNSHCALILEELTPTPAPHNYGSREKSNGNNNYEMREFNRRLLLSNGNSPGAGVTAASQSRHT
ncbi:uncharacterized protein LOC107263279 [Cephus cinctus]|uniref:Uncharacterized protein LOC107263279 n=1 Tax=Cephus cinctus TaxID=211228 RepID=A0AAJ7BGZ2_CEPCN|nr:uncharacterized protein LOC107263279 [Cephus cinctus]